MRYGEPDPQAAPAAENQKQGLHPQRTRANSVNRRKPAPFNRRQQLALRTVYTPADTEQTPQAAPKYLRIEFLEAMSGNCEAPE